MSLIDQINADREAQKDDAIETQAGFDMHELSEIVRRWGVPFVLTELARVVATAPLTGSNRDHADEF